MPLDPLIANPATIKLDNPLETYTNFLQAQHLQSEIAKAQRLEADDQATNALYKRHTKTDGTIDRSGLLADAGQSNLGKLIPGMQKGWGDLDKTAAETAGIASTSLKNQADAAKANADANEKEWQTLITRLGGVSMIDPIKGKSQMAQIYKESWDNPRLAKWQTENGHTPQSDIAALESNSADPNSWSQYAMSTLMGAKAAADAQIQLGKQHYEQIHKGTSTKVIALPDSVLPGAVAAAPTTVANETVVPAKGTTINIDNGQKLASAYEQKRGELQATKDDALDSAASQAQNNIDRIEHMRSIIKSGDVYTGAGANLKLNAARVAQSLGSTGFDSTIANTQDLDKNLAQNGLQEIAHLRGMGVVFSHGLTNKEFEQIQASIAANKALSPEAMDRLLSVQQDGWRQLQKMNSERSNALNGSPHLGQVNHVLGVTLPASSARGSFSPSIEQYRPLVEKYARMDGVDPELVMHILTKENAAGDPLSMNHNSNGSVDTGLMQVNSIHGFTPKQLQDPDFNIKTGVGILAGSLKAHPGDLRAGIKGYNGGGTAADNYAADVLSRYAPPPAAKPKAAGKATTHHDIAQKYGF